MYTRILRTNILVSILFLFLSGCSSERSWRYSVDSYPTDRHPLLSKRVAVPPFRDLRPDKNENTFLLAILPLVPFGWVDYSTPELEYQKLATLPVWQFKFAEDFAKAAAEELDASNLFKEAFFTSSASAGDLVLRGDIKSTRYWGKVFSYGFSINAPGLWFLGLPQGTIHNELEVEFTLVDQANGVLLWNKSYKMAYHKSPFWIYKIPSDFDYDNMFKAMMRDVVKSLESTLSDSAVLDSR
ncbi:MAG: hypothetical protein HY201_04660 [Nitrospirae bacterium]|nr:hypothetical protein [Candidatus Troglogloeales bacterium]MBI3598720.1 hypothetical protein [Candidatus Troglogloeales bacterium]